MKSDELIKNLNEEQKKAVLSTEGPNLVVAGAGSGKTKVLTTRLAYIINQKKAWSNQILCVTFTNKAAKEMQNRVLGYLREKSNSVPWLGTFHSISVKFLRRHAEALGLKSNFTILDTDDQKKLIKKICTAENIDAKKISPQFIIAFIDQWKNKGFLPKNVKLEKSSSIIKSILKVYEIYQNKTKDLNAFDFGDLILFCVKLFEEHKDIREIYHNNFKYILVDEFQDTDPLQAEIVLLLTADNPKETNWRLCQIIPGSLFVVGDPKQSIYRFRRADIGTFNFVKERIKCSGGRILQLHSNFRSNPELVEWINEHFAGLFEGQQVEMSEQYGPGFTASQASRSVSIPGVLTGMRQLRVRSRNVRAEAEAIATFIRRAMDRRLTVSRSSKDEDPACRPSDFMLVTWDTGQLSTYADALYAEGIPCDVTGRKGTDSKNDLWLLHLCLRVGADSDDTIAALAVLRGPLFGFSDPDLEAFHRAGGCIDGRLRVPDGLKDKILTHRFEHASKTFHRWRRLLGALPPVAAIERIINESGLLLVASSANGEAGRRGRAAWSSRSNPLSAWRRFS